jgi:hypothetical protein
MDGIERLRRVFLVAGIVLPVVGVAAVAIVVIGSVVAAVVTSLVTGVLGLEVFQRHCYAAGGC